MFFLSVVQGCIPEFDGILKIATLKWSETGTHLAFTCGPHAVFKDGLEVEQM